MPTVSIISRMAFVLVGIIGDDDSFQPDHVQTLNIRFGLKAVKGRPL